VKLARHTRYTDLCWGDVSVVETVELADEVSVPFIVLGELRVDMGRKPGPAQRSRSWTLSLKPGVRFC
jgi:hypothetical protein